MYLVFKGSKTSPYFYTSLMTSWWRFLNILLLASDIKGQSHTYHYVKVADSNVILQKAKEKQILNYRTKPRFLVIFNSHTWLISSTHLKGTWVMCCMAIIYRAVETDLSPPLCLKGSSLWRSYLSRNFTIISKPVGRKKISDEFWTTFDLSL